MAYTINKTDGNVLATVSDGTINTAISSLTLIGKNYAGYGEFQNENFVKLLENAASATAPSTPLHGQLWYDKTNNLLKVYNGSVFRVISGATASSSAPSGQVAGDLWYDTANAQLKVYNGSSNILIGPSYSATTGTSGAIVDTVLDGSGGSHVVVKVFAENTIVAIYSKDATFTPASAITGFATVGPGLNLSTTVSNAVFKGTATNADLLDSLNSTSFMRSDTNTSTTGTLTVDSDNGLYVGVDDDVRVYVSGTTSYIKGQTSDGNLLIQVNDGGVTTTCMTFVGSTSNVNIDTRLVVTGNITGGNVTTAGTANVATLAVTGAGTVGSTLGVTGNITGGNLSVSTGTVTAGNIVNGNGNGVGNIGSSSTYFNTVFAKSTSAQYADLAERFAADQPYSPGTVVELGGAAEITQAVEDLSDRVFGVISTHPAHLMNGGAGDNLTHPPIAMTGRVPVRVVGKVRKGDRLVSAGFGLARSAKNNEITAFNVIGRSLGDKESINEGIIEAIVTIN